MDEQLRGMSASKIESYRRDIGLLQAVYQFFLLIQDKDQELDSLGFDTQLLDDEIYDEGLTISVEYEADLNAKIVLWRQVLEKFDAQMPVAQVRHRFENEGLPNAETLEMLLAFYFTKEEKLDADRDKVDLIVTRWGRMSFQGQENEILLPVLTAQSRLEAIYQRFNLTVLMPSELESAVALIEQERKQLLTIRSLRELMEKQVLLKIRKLKNELSEFFFQPTILNEIVALNIGLHNVFQDLLLAEQGRLNGFLQPMQNSVEQQVTSADQALVTMIERSAKTGAHTAVKTGGHTAVAVAPQKAQPRMVEIDAAELSAMVDSMRSLLSALDIQLLRLAEKINS